MAADQTFVNALHLLSGKFVQVRVRQTKVIDVSPGEANSGYFLVDYKGDVLSPAVRPYPENQPNGPLCLYLQTRDQTRKVFALDVNDIEEVDDEVKEVLPVSLSISGLTNPGAG